MTQIKNKIQDLELKNLKEQVESLCGKISNIQYDFGQFVNNHFSDFKENNAKEHSVMKEQISEFKGQFKWIAPILLAILGAIISFYFK